MRFFLMFFMCFPLITHAQSGIASYHFDIHWTREHPAQEPQRWDVKQKKIEVPISGASQEGFFEAACAPARPQPCQWQWTLAISPQGYNPEGHHVFVYRMTLLSNELQQEEIQGIMDSSQTTLLRWQILPYQIHLRVQL